MDWLIKILVTIGSCASIGFDMWHFFVPHAWKWYSCMVSQATELVGAFVVVALCYVISLIGLCLPQPLLIIDGAQQGLSRLSVVADWLQMV